jgi:hypothetical protein
LWTLFHYERCFIVNRSNFPTALRTGKIVADAIIIRQFSLPQPPLPAGFARAVCSCGMVEGAALPRYPNMLGN